MNSTFFIHIIWDEVLLAILRETVVALSELQNSVYSIEVNGKCYYPNFTSIYYMMFIEALCRLWGP